jgi:hypothetical protein
MKIKYFLLGFFFITNYIHSQSVFGPVSGNPIRNHKLVKINIHYINHPSYKEGFTPTDDSYGNPYSGYDHAIDVTNTVNKFKILPNEDLHLPNYLKLPAQIKGYEVVLDAVYFHEDKDLSYLGNGNPLIFSVEKDSVINCFFPLYNSQGYSGYAIQNILTDPYNSNGSSWQDYIEYRKGIRNLWDGFVPFCQTLAHELGHNLGLGHPTQNCPCLGGSTNFPSNTCDDFLNPINDTPTAYEMYQSYGKHPSNNLSCANRCSWGSATQTSCSNNLMDYTNGIALSPKQIEFIHIALEGGFYNNNPHPFLKRYTVCESILQDRDYCDLPYHKFSFYGKKIKIGGCADSPSEIIVHSKGAAKKIYFSQSVDFYQTTDFLSSTLIFEMQPYIPQTDPILDIRFADCSVNFKYK